MGSQNNSLARNNTNITKKPTNKINYLSRAISKHFQYIWLGFSQINSI